MRFIKVWKGWSQELHLYRTNKRLESSEQKGRGGHRDGRHQLMCRTPSAPLKLGGCIRLGRPKDTQSRRNHAVQAQQFKGGGAAQYQIGLAPCKPEPCGQTPSHSFRGSDPPSNAELSKSQRLELLTWEK